jgi:murein DD-endopeptidase MepM/ murein hydrolase activator NlpD
MDHLQITKFINRLPLYLPFLFKTGMFFLKKSCFVLILLIIFLKGEGQVKYYANPLKIPPSLSGNFGELRPDHFHTGLDFRTQQKTGIPVYASAEGYVSRIVVSPTGYGKVIYLDHPNGTTTLYGHLNKFRHDLEEYVKMEQYERQSFAVDLKISEGKFQVGKGEQIALSGNSGSSGGPHLHFEIRDSRSQDAFNPLIMNDFNVKDKTPPRLVSVRIYPMDSRSHINLENTPRTFPVKLIGKSYSLSPGTSVKAFGNIGVAINASDYFDNDVSPCGIYSASLFVNGSKLFAYNFGRISFEQNRYLNSYIDYAEYEKTGVRFRKLWQDRGNRLNIYESDRSGGILQIDEEKDFAFEVVLGDAKGNKSELKFNISGKKLERIFDRRESDHSFRFDSRNSFSTDDFEIHASNGTFYEDFTFTFSVLKKLSGYYSSLFHVHENTVPLHKPVKISLLTDRIPTRLHDKALMVMVDKMGNKTYAGGKLSGKWMEGTILRFGDYAVVCDTVPPKIISPGIKNNTLTESGSIRFKISDDLSGIQSYIGLIDGEWALFEYDPKINSLVYFIDRSRLKTGKRHTIQLTVTDKVNNTSVYKATFWK